MRLGFRRPGAPRGAYTPEPLFRRSRRPYATWAAIGFILTFLYVLVLFLSAQSIGAVHIVAGAS
ncbi:MAG: hypothetical protein L3J86_03405, partial [Thermoplasmata archaeon]|nr:hypothetical protein [Thermoplasmata archaeon]